MIYIHKDEVIKSSEYIWFEHFCKLLKVDYKIINAQDRDFITSLDTKDDDILIARFGHDKEDKINTVRVLPILNKKFKRMYPSTESYHYYDDKLKQYEFMLENNIPCLDTYYVSSKEEIEKLNIDFPIVAKKTWGAGAEQINYFETLDSVVDDETTRGWTEKSIYPCLVQEYSDCEYDLRLNIVNSKVFMERRLHLWKTENKDNFPYGMPETPREKVLKYRYPPYEPLKTKECTTRDFSDNYELIKQLYSMQKKLNTNYMSWDIVNGKVLEFSVQATRDARNTYLDMNDNQHKKYDYLSNRFISKKLLYEILYGLINV